MPMPTNLNSGLFTGKMKPLTYEAIPGLLTKEPVLPIMTSITTALRRG